MEADLLVARIGQTDGHERSLCGRAELGDHGRQDEEQEQNPEAASDAMDRWAGRA
jgi:hypothetical protein